MVKSIIELEYEEVRERVVNYVWDKLIEQVPELQQIKAKYKIIKETPEGIKEEEVEGTLAEKIKMALYSILEEFAYYLYAFQKIRPNPIALAQWIGKYFRIWKRNYTTITGVLVGLEIAPVRFEILVDEKHEDYWTKAKIHEVRVTEIDVKSCLYYEPIFLMEVEEPQRKEGESSESSYI